MPAEDPPLGEELEEEAEWRDIRKRIDREYLRKLKRVNDEAVDKLKAFEDEHLMNLERTQFLYQEDKRARSRAYSRASRQSRASAASRSSDASLGNLSFVSNYKRSSPSRGRQDRNRFFSPKAVPTMPPEEPEGDSETGRIIRFYREYLSVVKRNITKDNQIYLIDVLEQLHFLDDESVNDYKMELC